MEFGLYHGSTFFFLARLLDIFHNAQQEVHQTSTKHLYGFELFDRLKEFSSEDGSLNSDVNKESGAFHTDKADFYTTLEHLRSDSRIGRRIHVVEGDVSDTFPKFIEENPGIKLSFVLLDMDLYWPTKVVLERLMPLMVPGGSILFDNYGFAAWPGETKAVDEFVVKYDLRLQSIPWSFAPGAYCTV